MLKGVILNKDVTHARMRRRIENPRIILLDCNLEYKKGESQVGAGSEHFAASLPPLLLSLPYALFPCFHLDLVYSPFLVYVFV